MLRREGGLGAAPLLAPSLPSPSCSLHCVPLELSWGHPLAQHREAPHTSHSQEVPPKPPGRSFCGIYPNKERNLQLQGEGRG